MREGVRAHGRRGRALAAAVLVLGIAAGAGVAATVAAAERRTADAALRLRAETARTALATVLQRYADTVADLTAVVAGRPWAELGPSLDTLVPARLPGAHEITVIRAGTGPGDTAQPVPVLSRVLDGTAPPERADDAELTRTLQTARRTGRPTLSAAHVLPPDRSLPTTQQQLAVILAAPMNAGTGFRGWVTLSLRAGDVLDEAMRDAAPADVTTVLSDVDPHGRALEIARWGGPADAGVPDRTVEVALAQRRWQLAVRPTTPLLSPAERDADIATLAAGITLSLLLAAMVLMLTAHSDRAAATLARVSTARRADSDRLLRTEAALREREAELAGFAAVATDSLRVPLANVASFTELLIEEAAPTLDPAARGFLERISDSTQQMAALVDELLTYTEAADAPLRLEPVDLGPLFAALVAEHVAALPTLPSIDVGALPVVTADAALLRQVFDHLLANAIRYVRHGSGARVTVGARQDSSGWWRIEIADRGIGIPPEQRARVFDPFHRTAAAEGYPGSGLGLAICQRIIRLHGGEIGVESNPGGGSVFWFTVFDGRSAPQSGEHPHFSANRA